MPNTAISVRNAFKSYGQNLILKDLSMTVERGTIYGLLGASGCGKTTLLSCIVGRKKVDSGDVLVLDGKRPGVKGSGIPGRKVGYMPQEIALIEEFTVRDTIYYFGTIFKMKHVDIKEKFQELSRLLELPPPNKLLKKCSGGQKRRVSFAAALLHNPEIVILDEPTVGVDPILRDKIWTYLKGVVTATQISVIITTHYIDEAKDATKVGLMREGKLLIEETPHKLLTMFQRDTLEEVFLVLSEKQERHELIPDSNIQEHQNQISLETISTTTSVESFVADYGSIRSLSKPVKDKSSKTDNPIYMSAFTINAHRMQALFVKNWKQCYRNKGGLVFLVLFPIMQMFLFMHSVGSDPKHLNLGIVNNESITIRCNNFSWNDTAIYEDFDCRLQNLTCRFLTYLEHPMINKIAYKTFPDALEGIKHGNILGVLYSPTNFSKSFERRIRLGAEADTWTTDYGELKVYMDMSNKMTGAVLAFKLYNLFLDFQKDLLKDCHLSEKLGIIPMDQQFVYGDPARPMTIFHTPGMTILLIYLLGATLTSQTIVKEKMEGIWDRSIIAGVSSMEITLSHLLFESVVIVLECAEIMGMMYLIPEIEIVGNPWTLFLLLYLQGLCGMAYGFLASAICRSSGAANIVCTGGYLPLTLITGVIWPTEAMPTVLRWISLACPCTMTIQSFRNVMSKGWGLFEFQVISSVGVSFGWILIFALVSVWLIKIKQ